MHDEEQTGGGPPQRDTSFEPGMPDPGPAWHRASMRPEGEGAESAETQVPGMPPAAALTPPPPPPPPPPATAPSTTAAGPPAAPTGAHLAAGIFLTVGGGSLFAGVIGLLAAQGVGYPANAAGCGIVFAALFVLAVLLRPGVGGEALRGALGVTSIFFLVACFGFAVDLPGSGGIDGESVRVKLAAVAGLFALGMGGVGVAVPSSVATGLGAAGAVGTVVLSLITSGVSAPVQLAAGALATAAALMLVGLRVPAIRPHRTGLAWLTGVAAVVAAAASVTLAVDFNGIAVAAVAALTLALALLAWRHRLVAPAIAAVPALAAVEVWVVQQAAGHDRTGQAAVALVAGVILLVLAGVAATAVRVRITERPARPVGLTEVLLVAVAVLAIASLTQTSASHLQVVPAAPNGSGAQLQG